MLKKLNSIEEVERVCNKYLYSKLVVRLYGIDKVEPANNVRRNYAKLIAHGAEIFFRKIKGRTKLTDSDRDDICVMFTMGLTPVKQIAKKYSCTDQGIRGVLKAGMSESDYKYYLGIISNNKKNKSL
jgi:Mor family transcriptional regulator